MYRAGAWLYSLCVYYAVQELGSTHGDVFCTVQEQCSTHGCVWRAGAGLYSLGATIAYQEMIWSRYVEALVTFV